MTNYDTTPQGATPPDGHRRRFRPFLKVSLAALLAALGVGIFAGTASAHTNTVNGAVACSAGDFTITWTIANDYDETETATVPPGGVTFGNATLSSSSVNIALTPGGTPPDSTGTLTQTLPLSDAGQPVTISVQGTWSDGYTTLAPLPTGTVTLPSSCAIAVVKSANATTVTAGQSTPVTYTLAVTNTSTAPEDGSGTTTVTDAVPTGTTYVAGSAACGTGTGGTYPDHAPEPSCTPPPSEAGGIVSYTLTTNLEAGATADLTFEVTINANAPATIPNTADYTGPGCTTAAPGCPTNTVTLVVTPAPVPPNVTVTKSANFTTVAAGQSTPVTYTLVVKNTAPSASTTLATVVTDVLPSGITFVPGSASCGALTISTTPSCKPTYKPSTKTLTYTLGAGIAGGASYPVTFQAKVNASAKTSIVNHAKFTGNCTVVPPAKTCRSNQVIIPVNNFTVTKSDSDGSSDVNPGDVITYTLTVANVGSGPGSITVTDGAPVGTTLTTPAAACPAGTATTCSVTVTGSHISWVITTMPGGATYGLTFAVKVNANATGQVVNTGTYTDAGCTTAGGCSTNTTTNPIPPPTSSTPPATTPPATTPPTTPTTPAPPTLPSVSTPAVTAPVTEPLTAISGATTVHTGEPWAGSRPYVLLVFGFGLSLLGFGGIRRRRVARAAVK